MPGRGNRDSMLVPTNTLCSAEAYATLKGNGPDGKPNGRQLIVKKNIKKCFYIVKAKYLTYSVDKDICNMKKEFSNFRALTPEELAQYSRSLVPPPGRFINWL
ncbi:hypothetical protein GSI_04009 [Ganoderma sinense ZZ0214-1]|uniref:Uncharacterized protein n=1 Tax=Ganoderma sinense ZZ0214-1 TaxID=1077348 RepID=A0A2G8SHZ3_9APHY|nr:hypothetical protein GSI_04009 [Ganoderma sinense ZZ0214-1]